MRPLTWTNCTIVPMLRVQPALVALLKECPVPVLLMLSLLGLLQFRPLAEQCAALEAEKILAEEKNTVVCFLGLCVWPCGCVGWSAAGNWPYCVCIYGALEMVRGLVPSWSSLRWHLSLWEFTTSLHVLLVPPFLGESGWGKTWDCIAGAALFVQGTGEGGQIGTSSYCQGRSIETQLLAVHQQQCESA